MTLKTANPGSVQGAFRHRRRIAKAGTDYIAISGDLTFAPGQITKFIPVTVKGDSTKEPTETFNLRLSNQTAEFTFKDAVGGGTITNDD